MTVLFKENVREIGKALDLAKRRYHDQYGAQLSDRDDDVVR